MQSELTIGELSNATGCKIPTIRYYESIGLLSKPRRSGGNQRRYGREHLVRLAFIRQARKLGFSQMEIRGLQELTDHPDQSCAAVMEIARTHLNDVDRRIARLRALRLELDRMIRACDGGRTAECRIIQTLADCPPDGR
jgi:DNA-binding transcriptional MerR regulator